MNLKKFLKEKKKILMIVGIVLLVLICIFAITRCSRNPLRGKKNLNQVYYDLPAGLGNAETDKGSLESGMKWNSVKYAAGSVSYTIMRYEGRSVEEGVARSEKLKEKKINGVKYYYKKTKIDDTHTINRYYTQVGDDTYYILVVFKNSTKNQKDMDEFLNSIIINNKK